MLRKLSDLVDQADEIYLATDPDREGEAIAWHVAAQEACRKLPRLPHSLPSRQKNLVRRRQPHPLDYVNCFGCLLKEQVKFKGQQHDVVPVELLIVLTLVILALA